MADLFNKGPKVEVPEWASFLNANQYSLFLKTVNDHLLAKNVDFTIDDGVVHCAENNLGYGQMGLHNVAQLCYGHEEQDWPQVIENHFNSLVDAQKFQDTFSEDKKSFEQVKSYISSRVYSPSYLFNKTVQESTLHREIADGLIEVLVFDLPHSVQNIVDTTANLWGKTEEELFELGRSNSRTTNPPNLMPFDQEFGKVIACSTDHFFSANIIHDLDVYPELIGKHGSLVSVPNRHNSLIYPINDERVIPAIQWMIPSTIGMHSEGPGSISDVVYWYSEGKLLGLPVSRNGEKLDFTPPEVFVEMLNAIAGDE